jgi:hypothetical protein
MYKLLCFTSHTLTAIAVQVKANIQINKQYRTEGKVNSAAFSRNSLTTDRQLPGQIVRQLVQEQQVAE